MVKAGDMIANLYEKDRWRTTNNFGTRVVFPSDSIKVLDFVRIEFPEETGWLLEIKHALQECKCVISVVDGKIVGFACYDCTGKGYFGPFGVAEEYKKRGIGTEILCECFDLMKAEGYGYAIIGWVDASDCKFYEKVADAWYIPNSEPSKTLYSRKIVLTPNNK